MDQESRSVLAYTKKKFVERPEFEELVTRLYPTPRLESLVVGSPLPPIHLHGTFGIGKSWLAYHFCSQKSDKQQPEATRATDDASRLLVSLVPPPPDPERPKSVRYIEPPPSEDEQSISQWIQSLLNWLAEQLSIPVTESAPASQLIFWITRDLSTQARPLVLLIDGLNEVSDSLLAELESYLLAPLAVLPHVRLVLVEPSSYPWSFPTLRVEIAPMTLAAFDHTQIKKQVEKMRLPALALDDATLTKIEEFGGGVPLHTACLATAIADKKLQDGLRQGMEDIISHILRKVPAPRREQVRSYLEALCIRDEGFHETMMVPLLAKHPNSGVQEEGGTRDLRRAREIRNELFDAGLITSNAALYVMEKPTRLLFERYLETYNPDLWTTLHQAALTRFRQWAEEVSKENKGYYEERAQFHQKRLEQAAAQQA